MHEWTFPHVLILRVFVILTHVVLVSNDQEGTLTMLRMYGSCVIYFG